MSIEEPSKPRPDNSLIRNTEDAREIETVIMEDLRPRFEKIIKELHGKFENDEYFLVIGDDASGRIPTLVMASFMRRIAQSKGRKPPPVRFIDNPGAPQFKGVLQGWTKKYSVAEKRVLLITECLESFLQ